MVNIRQIDFKGQCHYFDYIDIVSTLRALIDFTVARQLII